MICNKCNGSGLIENTKYYELGAAKAYENNVNPTYSCRNCGGSGFIIGNMTELVEHLNYLKEHFIHTNERSQLRAINQCLKIITQ